MSARPRIFISAVSKELKGARQAVANSLTFLGYEPLWQDIFGTEQGDLRDMLRRKVDGCEGLIQLTGQRFGFGPSDPAEDKAAVSYTQFELLYARKREKKVWPILLAEDFPVDTPNDESDAQRENQSDYRRRIGAESNFYQEAEDLPGLENVVLKLRQPLDELRDAWRKTQRRAARFRVFAAVALVAIFLVAWWIHVDVSETKSLTGQWLAVLKEFNRRDVDTTVLNARGEIVSRDAEIFAGMSGEGGLPADASVSRLREFAQGLAKDEQASAFDRAMGAFTMREFETAERFALAAADEAKAAVPPRRRDAVRALTLAGHCALRARDNRTAAEHFTAASQLTDKARAPLDWASVNLGLSLALYQLGQYTPSVARGREVVRIRGEILGAKDSRTLVARNNLAVSEMASGNFAEAEAEFRGLIKAYERGPGALQHGTLTARNNLVGVLLEQAKYAEAVTEARALVEVRTRHFGAEHPDTLTSRMNLASALMDVGRREEGRREARVVLEIQERVLTPEHPATLSSRNNLAAEWSRQGKHEQAVAEHRAVLKARLGLFGDRHPDTLTSRNNLAIALLRHRKLEDAEREFRALLDVRNDVSGPTHPRTLQVRHNLGGAILRQERYEEAERLFRPLIEVEDGVLGKGHVETLGSRNNLALALLKQKKMAESEAVSRVVLREATGGLGLVQREWFTARDNLVHVLTGKGEHEEAEQLLRAAVADRERTLGKRHRGTLRTRIELGSALIRQKKLPEATAVLGSVLEDAKGGTESIQRTSLLARDGLVSVLMTQRKFKEAEEMVRASIAARERLLGRDHPDVIWTMLHLVVALKEQSKVDAVRTACEHALERAKAALGADHPYTKRLQTWWDGLQPGK